MAKYVISDIHGYKNRFFDVLQKAEFDWDNDELYVLGDIMDRGPHSAEMLYWAVEEAPDSVHFLLGNHEDMAYTPLLEIIDELGLDYCLSNSAWRWNGGYKTLRDCKDFYGIQWCHKAASWINQLPLYYIINDKLLVHAGLCNGGIRLSDDYITDGRKDYVKIPGIEEEQWAQHLLWIRERWLYDQTDYPYDIIFGHTPTSSNWMDSVNYYSDKMIYTCGELGDIVKMLGYKNGHIRYCIDTGRQRMGLLRLDDYAEFYSDLDEQEEE